MVAQIETTFVVELELRGDEPVERDAVSTFIGDHVVFLVFPYVRAALSRLPTELGLPSIVLPYLTRSVSDSTPPAMAE